MSSLNPDTLVDLGIRYIRIQWLDLTNNTRYRVLPLPYFLNLLASARPSISIAKGVLGLVFSTLAPGFSPIGEYLYAPDLESLRICPYAKDHASVMGWFQEKRYLEGPDGIPTMDVQLCPRTALRRVLEDAKASSQIEFLVGFETEFILLRSTSPIVPVNNHSYSTSQSLPAGSIEEKVLSEIADALQESGIELQMYHAEAAPGQYEVVTGPLQPLQAADALVHTREIIYHVANKHGLRATLAPRVYPDHCGSATHAHISIHPSSPPTSTSTNTNTSTTLTPPESAFLSSLLTHLPALTPFTLPIPASYARIADGVWSGGTHVCWGSDNREAPIRLCNPAAAAIIPNNSRNFEFKCLDGIANPYIALAAILGVGHVGIKTAATAFKTGDYHHRYSRIPGDCCGPKTAADMSEDERKALGITQRMPLSWKEAWGRLDADPVVRGVLGEELVTKYFAVNKTLAGLLDVEGMSAEEGLKFLVENY